jgi:DNA-binding response OmpR family regulator/chromosome segregation ATPase
MSSGFDTSQIARILTYGHNDTLGARPTTDTRKRVLLIEADGFIRMRLMSCLVAAGFDVDTAPNGTLGLAKLRIFAPDTIILDLNVGGTSGLKVIQESRRYAGFENKPIYAFTFADFIKRNARKELAAAGVRVFDKMTISEENFVCNIAAEVLKGKSDVESLAGNAAVPARTTDAGAPVQGRLNETVDDACQQAKRLASCADAAQLAETCATLREKVYSVLSCAAVGGLRNTARQAKALVGYLDQLGEQPHNLSTASLDTIEGGVEMLSSLASESAGDAEKVSNFNVVVVDDASASREAVTNALEDAGLASSAFADSVQALDHLSGTPADLIIAKLAPDANPEAALASIRALELHSETPVIFVPSPTAPDHSGSSGAAASAGPETQPVMPMEILVKALNVLQSGAKTDAPAPPDTEMLQAAQPEEVEPSRIDSSRAEIIPDRPMGDPLAPASLPWLPVEPGVVEPQFVAEQEQPAPKPASRRKQKRTILLVEDDPVLLKLYRRGLSKEGFKVETAEDGMAALDVLPKVRPDLVVLDIMLPKLHGLEVLKFIRTDVNLKDTPVIILSNAFMESLASRAMKAGANKGLLKSDCTPAKLVSVIHDLLPTAQEVPADAPEPEPAPGEMVNPGDFEETAIWVRKNNTLRDAPAEILKIRQACAAYAKAAGTDEGDVCLEAFYRNVRLFCSRAGQSGFTKIDWVASALEALLFEITYKQLKPTPSTMRTIAQAVDCIGQLVESGDTTLAEQMRKPKILVVDDDAVCTLTTVAALRMARVEAIGTQNPRESLQMLEEDTFDMVILDIDMPEINGFEVCEQLRKMPRYKTCPVMFVTSMQAVDSRARGILAGASEFVNKPIPPAELTLKVTLLMAKSAQTEPPQSQAGEFLPTAADVEAAAAATEAVEQPAAPAGNEQITIVEQNFVVNPGADTLMPPADIEPVFVASSEAAPPADVPAVEPVSEAPPSNLEEQPIESGNATGAPPESRDKLVARIYNTEVQLHHERERIKRRDRTIELLKKEIQQLKDETVPATQPSALAEAAGAAAKQAKQALELAEARCNQLEHDLTEMWKVRDELNGQLTWEQAHAAELDKRGKDLEGRLTENTTALQKSKEELEKATKDRTQAEADLKQQLTATGAAQQQAQARCNQLETDLAALLQSREQLNLKVAQQEGQAARLNKRGQELESSLNERSAELVRVKSELDQQGKERAQAEFELRSKLETADAAQKNAQARCNQLETDLAGMRQAREELSQKVSAGQSQATDLSKRSQDLEKSLNERSSELAQAKADQEKQAKERAQAESDLRGKLETADAGQKHAQSRCGQLEQELATLKLAREELNQKVTQEHGQASELSKRGQELEKSLVERGAELDRAKAELQKQAKERVSAELEMRTRLESVEASQKQSQARCVQLEQELSGLKQVRAELDQRVVTEHELALNLSKRSYDLEKGLSERGAELDRAKAELDKQTKERAQVEADWRKRFEEADGGHKQSQSRCSQLEQELAGLKQAREELNQKVTQEHGLASDLSKRGQALEKSLAERTAELDRARSEHDKQTKDHSKVEQDLRQKLDAADAGQKQAQARCNQLEQELTGLKQVRDELNLNLSREQGQATELGKRSKELEKSLAERTAELGRVMAELEKQAKSQSKSEGKLRKQLAAAEAVQKQAQSRCSQLEQDLAGMRKTQDELNARVVREQGQAAELNKRSQELEKGLNERSAELARARGELDRLAKERSQTEAEFRARLETADGAHRQAHAHTVQLEQELAGLKQVREELNQKVTQEHGQASELGRKAQELEKSLAERTAELARAKADFQKQASDRSQSEGGLRGKLEAADLAHKQAQSLCGRLETELAELRQAREALNRQVALEQGHTSILSKRGQELEKSLAERSAELDRAKTELDKQVKERSQVEAELRGKLDASDAAQKQSQLRCAHLEQELTGLKQVREELNQKVTQEHGQASELSKRSQELEKSLAERGLELARAKADLEKQAKDSAHAVADLRAILDGADAAQRKALSRCAQLEQELAGLKQVREELNQKVTKEHGQASELSRRSQELEKSLAERGAELTSARADLEKQARERAQAETEWRSKFEASGAAQKQTQSRCSQLESELAGLKQARTQLDQQVASEHELAVGLSKRSYELERTLGERSAELDRATAELDKQAKERAHIEADLRGKLDATDSAQKQAQARCSQLEQELATFKQAREELQGKLIREQALVNELDKRQKELQGSLGEKAAELDKQARDRSLVESDLRQKLDASDTTQKQSQARCSQLEHELAGLQQAREDLNGKLAREQAQVAELQKQGVELEKRVEQTECVRRDTVAELEQRIQQGVVSLAQATSAMETERAGRARAELRNADLTKQLEDLHEQLSRSLQNARNSLQQIGALEKQLRDNQESFARVTADLRHEQAQARLVYDQSAKAKELNGQFQQNIAWLSEANRVLVSDQKSLQAMVEKSLGSLHETEGRLHHEAGQRLREREEFEAAQRNLASQQQKIERLEAQIAEATAAITEFESRSKKESTERHNLLSALQAAQREAQLRTEQSRLEMSKLQMSLQHEQLERKRLETDQVRLRHSSLESARAARVVRNNLRRRIRQPITDLSQSTRLLLGLELNVEQKALVEAILKDALLVNERLQESPAPGPEPEPAPVVAK